MIVKGILKFMGEVLVFILATTIFMALVTALGTVATILLLMLGQWIGIGANIFVYVAMFCIFWKAWDVLTWIVDKIIEHKKERDSIFNKREERQ